MCIVAQQRRLSSAAFQIYCIIPETYVRPVVQGIKLGYSGVLSHPCKCNEIQVVWQQGPGHIYMHVEGGVFIFISSDRPQVSLFSSFVCFLLFV